MERNMEFESLIEHCAEQMWANVQRTGGIHITDDQKHDFMRRAITNIAARMMDDLPDEQKDRWTRWLSN
jgi:hypothetical protein